MKRSIILVLVMVFWSQSALGFREGTAASRDRKNHGACSSELNLTVEQRSELQSKRDGFLIEISPLRDRLFSKRMELRELWNAAQPDQVKIAAKNQEIMEIQREIQERATRHQLECLEILSEEQRKQMLKRVGHRPGGGNTFTDR